MPAHTPIWKAIATDLCDGIAEGVYGTGDNLPTEAALARTIGMNVDSDGVPVELGHTWFAADKVTLTLNDR